MDQRAQIAGYSNTADYVDYLQGKQDTRSFEGANNRTCWVNEAEKVYGWNHKSEPENSTVIPARKAGKEFENHKKEEARALGVERIEERSSLSQQERTVARGPSPKETATEISKAPDQNDSTAPSKSNKTDNVDLTKVNLPQYAASEHGYKIEKTQSPGKFFLDKGSERLEVSQAKDGSWSYENQKNTRGPDGTRDQGTILDFAARRGAGDAKGAEAAVTSYLQRNPDEQKKAVENSAAARTASEQAPTRSPAGRDE